jgi:hypothetical protein
VGGAGFETRSETADAETRTRIPIKIAFFNLTSLRGVRIQESAVRKAPSADVGFPLVSDF